MKTRFSTFDLAASVTELQKLLSLRVYQVYDVDHRTYIIKLKKQESKATLILESGNRIHTTAFEWPKNPAPSGFTMKLRKHIRNKRLESLTQLGVDRIVDLKFGCGEAAHHIFLELYDRGNIVLTDHSYTILNVLRPRTEGEDARFFVRETYPVDRAHQPRGLMSAEELTGILLSAKEGDNFKKFLNPHLDYGPAVTEHVLHEVGFPANCRIGMEIIISRDISKVLSALELAENLMKDIKLATSKGYIIQKHEKRHQKDGLEEDFYSYQEFHPTLFHQHANQQHLELESFDKAVDEFFSKLEGQKIDMKAIQQEKEAWKKLENIKKDHAKRLENLHLNQEEVERKAQLIEMNQEIVDHAILVVRRAIANQLDWKAIWEYIKEAQSLGDFVANKIKGLKLEINHITMALSDPYTEGDSLDRENNRKKQTLVDIDLDLSAFSNARKHYNQKRNAAKKEQKTIESADKAFKSAQKKTKQTLREVAAIANINKARKVFWFEKFYWFITSENYLVIGGRDQQQNELIVKKYMTSSDIYVHADLHGATSVVIKNPSREPVPPKSLNEAGVMAVCYSAGWEVKYVTSAWWVYSEQVSKTAPSGEYLTTGSFMIRGKKNYLPHSHLIMGFGFVFKLEDGSIFRHKDERKVRGIEDDTFSIADSVSVSVGEEDKEIPVEDDENSEDTNEDEKDADVKGNRANDEDSAKPEGGDMHRNDTEVLNEEEGEVENADDEDTDDGDVEENCVDEGKSSDENEDGHFPDTQIAIEHFKGGQFIVRPFSASSAASSSQMSQETQAERKPALDLEGNQSFIIGSVAPKQKTQGKVAEKNKGKLLAQKRVQIEEIKEEKSMGDSVQQKRGQRGKLKKIKKKYKDQDEEERRMRMQILQSAGIWKENKKKKAKKGKDEPKVIAKSPMKQTEGRHPPSAFSGTQVPAAEGNEGETAQKLVEEEKQKENMRGTEDNEGETAQKPVEEEKQKENMRGTEDNEDEEEEEEKEPIVGTDLNELDSLTGIPVEGDELLFAVPVCAPYNSMVNYKFKVKMTPGNSRRGKAAKTALNLFLQDKGTSSWEKDLFRSVKDQDLARNIPGKVKLSTPQMQKSKHK